MLITLLAQTPTPSPAPRGGGLGSLLIFLPFILLFWLLIFRPQRRLRQQQMELQRSLEVGDEVETVAGMYGRVQRLDETTAYLEIAPGTTVRMAKGAIRRRVPRLDEPTAGQG